jgi:hypothetical protein
MKNMDITQSFVAAAEKFKFISLFALTLAFFTLFSNEIDAQTLPPPWQQQATGAVAEGIATATNGVFSIQAIGSSTIWGTSDEFYYVYQPLNGDGEIVARVASLQSTDPWAIAGVMIRETMASDSKNVAMVLSVGYGMSFQYRAATGGDTTYPPESSETAPYWVKLIRSGNTITGYKSQNGATWVQAGAVTISMNATVYVGLVATTYWDGVPCQALIEDVLLSGSQAQGDTTFATLFVPDIVAVPNSWTSQLTLDNRGASSTTILMEYTATMGGGSGTITYPLAAKTLTVIPDIIGHLRSQGLAIASGSTALGSLRLTFTGSGISSDVSASARTVFPSCIGAVGNSLPALPADLLLTQPVYIYGLQQDTTYWRSNLILTNGGASSQGNITLRVTVYDGSSGTGTVLSDVTLAPGIVNQISYILTSNGLSLTQGYVKVERVSGTAPYYAFVSKIYQNNASHYLLPVPDINAASSSLFVPDIVSVPNSWNSQLILVNRGSTNATLTMNYVASIGGGSGMITTSLAAGTQTVIADIMAYLRTQGLSIGSTAVGSLWLNFDGLSSNSVSAASVLTTVPVASPCSGLIGTVYQALRSEWLFNQPVYIYGLQEDTNWRSALILSNAGTPSEGSITLRVTVYDESTGMGTVLPDIGIAPGIMNQINQILTSNGLSLTQGYVKVERVSGTAPFYALVSKIQNATNESMYLLPMGPIPANKEFIYLGGKLVAIEEPGN